MGLGGRGRVSQSARSPGGLLPSPGEAAPSGSRLTASKGDTPMCGDTLPHCLPWSRFTASKGGSEALAVSDTPLLVWDTEDKAVSQAPSV